MPISISCRALLLAFAAIPALLSEVCLAQSPQVVIGTLKIYGNDSYPVPYRKAAPLDNQRGRYTGFKPGTMLLKKGSIRRKGAKPLPIDIIFERDVPVKLRDGIVMYTDVFRPVGNGTYPGIIGWGPYGKEIGGQHLDDVFRAGVPLNHLSELQKFEAADPAYWVQHGYTVLNPDSRGAYSSEGNAHLRSTVHRLICPRQYHLLRSSIRRGRVRLCGVGRKAEVV
jgi:predicted acyl esterase